MLIDMTLFLTCVGCRRERFCYLATHANGAPWCLKCIAICCPDWHQHIAKESENAELQAN